MKPSSKNRGTCPVCKYRVKVAVPKGGDGSARVCATHMIYGGSGGMRCRGSRDICQEDQR